MPRLRLLIALLVVAAVQPLTVQPLAAQRTRVLIVQGLPGEAQYKRQFDSATALIGAAAHRKWSVGDSDLMVLKEVADPSAGVAQSTRENIAAAFLTLSRRVLPGDVVLVVLIGHGSGEGTASKINVPGVDPTAADFAGWLTGFARQTVVLVNAATGSGDFVPVLQGPGRIVVTASRSAFERNESIFVTHFAAGLTGDAADADKDGRISVLEAFRYATREVARVYESTNRMQTEHAQVSDSLLAARVAFGGAAASTNARVAALVAERQALEADVAALRGKKAGMSATAYDTELERLLLSIAEKSQAIRAAGGTP